MTQQNKPQTGHTQQDWAKHAEEAAKTAEAKVEQMKKEAREELLTNKNQN